MYSGLYRGAAASYSEFRAWVWSLGLTEDYAGRVREPLQPAEDEMEIQARWVGGEFGREFTGTDREKIEIVQFGHWNRGAGPDFTEAAVRIDGEVHGGAIEIDMDARSWENHGHGVNPDFEKVVLHVFTDGPSLNRFFTRTDAHRNVVQLQLPQYTWSQGPPDFLPEAFPGRCVAPLASMSDSEVNSLLHSAAHYRLQTKARRLAVMSDSTNPEQVLFQALAEALGFGPNKTAMAVLAQRCPIRDLRKLDRVERDARLFGAAGFLGADVIESTSDTESRTYLRELWNCWWKIRDSVEPTRKRAIPWRVSGNRPLNHPQRRIGALSALVESWADLLDLWNRPVNKLEKHVNNLWKTLEHPFWEHHYTLRANPANRALRLVGKNRLRDILGNVVFPGAIKKNEHLWQEYLALRKVDTNQKIRRAGLRLFGPDRTRQKLFTGFYHQQQGLLQIYQDFCLKDLSECQNCPFPEQLIQWNENSGKKRLTG